MLNSLLIIVPGLLVGLGIRTLPSAWVSHRGERFRRTLQIIALAALNPIAFVGALWALPNLDVRLAFLPLVGLGTLVGAFFIGAFVARLLKLGPPRDVLFRTGISYTNIGNLGGLVVFQVIGEGGFALIPLYKLFEELWYYGFLFPHTNAGPGDEPLARRLGRVVRDPFVLVTVGAVLLGFGLHLTGWHRPEAYGAVNAVIVPISTFLLLITVGMSMKISISPSDLKPALVLAGLKITALPLLSLGLTTLAGLGGTSEATRTALILSCMPMAFLSMVPPTLYGLDGRFTNTAWALSMLSLALTIPAFLLLGW